MLDLGFLPDVERIVKAHPGQPADDAVLRHHARRRRHPRPPSHAATDQHPAEGHGAARAAANTRQHVFRAHQMDKIEVLAGSCR